MSDEQSEQKSYVSMMEQAEAWPEAVLESMEGLAEIAKKNGVSILCVVGVKHKTNNMSAALSPLASQSPSLPQMISGMAKMFTLMAERLTE